MERKRERKARVMPDKMRGNRIALFFRTKLTNLSKKEIAVLMGDYYSSAIIKWEKGTGIPNDVLVKLHEMGLNLNWLLTGEGEMLHPTPAVDDSSEEFDRPEGMLPLEESRELFRRVNTYQVVLADLYDLYLVGELPAQALHNALDTWLEASAEILMPYLSSEASPLTRLAPGEK